MTKKDLIDFVPASDYMQPDIHDDLASGVSLSDTLSWVPAPVVEPEEDQETFLEYVEKWQRRINTINSAMDVIGMFGFTGAGARWLQKEGWLFPKMSAAQTYMLSTHHSVMRGGPGSFQRWVAARDGATPQDRVASRDWRCSVNMAALWYLSKDPRTVMKMNAFTRAEIVRGPCQEKDLLDLADQRIAELYGLEDADWLLDSYAMLSSVAPLEELVKHSRLPD
jgi:hypothetical protein